MIEALDDLHTRRSTSAVHHQGMQQLTTEPFQPAQLSPFDRSPLYLSTDILYKPFTRKNDQSSPRLENGVRFSLENIPKRFVQSATLSRNFEPENNMEQTDHRNRTSEEPSLNIKLHNSSSDGDSRKVTNTTQRRDGRHISSAAPKLTSLYSSKLLDRRRNGETEPVEPVIRRSKKYAHVKSKVDTNLEISDSPKLKKSSSDLCKNKSIGGASFAHRSNVNDSLVNKNDIGKEKRVHSAVVWRSNTSPSVQRRVVSASNAGHSVLEPRHSLTSPTRAKSFSNTGLHTTEEDRSYTALFPSTLDTYKRLARSNPEGLNLQPDRLYKAHLNNKRNVANETENKFNVNSLNPLETGKYGDITNNILHSSFPSRSSKSLEDDVVCAYKADISSVATANHTAIRSTTSNNATSYTTANSYNDNIIHSIYQQKENSFLQNKNSSLQYSAPDYNNNRRNFERESLEIKNNNKLGFSLLDYGANDLNYLKPSNDALQRKSYESRTLTKESNTRKVEDELEKFINESENYFKHNRHDVYVSDSYTDHSTNNKISDYLKNTSKVSKNTMLRDSISGSFLPVKMEHSPRDPIRYSSESLPSVSMPNASNQMKIWLDSLSLDTSNKKETTNSLKQPSSEGIYSYMNSKSLPSLTQSNNLSTSVLANANSIMSGRNKKRLILKRKRSVIIALEQNRVHVYTPEYDKPLIDSYIQD